MHDGELEAVAEIINFGKFTAFAMRFAIKTWNCLLGKMSMTPRTVVEHLRSTTFQWSQSSRALHHDNWTAQLLASTRVSWFDVTCHTNSSPLWAAAVCFCMDVAFFSVVSYGVEFLLWLCNRHWSRMPPDHFSRRGKYSTYTAIDQRRPKSTSIAKFLTLPTQLCTCRALMRTKIGKIPSTDTTSWSAVRNGHDSFVFIDFLHAGGRKSQVT